VGRRPPTVVCDIDGVLATGGPEVYSDEAGWAYEKCRPIHEGIEMLQALHGEGCRIVLHTARWHKDFAKTEVWLEENQVPFDELLMGKPSGDVYIDDRAFRFPCEAEAAPLILEQIEAERRQK